MVCGAISVKMVKIVQKWDNFIIFVILGLGGVGVKKKFRKKGFFSGSQMGVRSEMGS